MDFTLAIENKRTPQALRWFFKILDIDKCGFINVETIRLFFRCVMDRMVDIDYSAADVIDEIFDMVKPKRKDRITYRCRQRSCRKINTVLSELAKFGVVTIRKAYGNWKSPRLKGKKIEKIGDIHMLI